MIEVRLVLQTGGECIYRRTSRVFGIRSQAAPLRLPDRLIVRNPAYPADGPSLPGVADVPLEAGDHISSAATKP